jgi:hypothetical protein
MKRVFVFFDRLEDKVRAKLSHYPILYAFIGGVGIVLFWRGVWHTADNIPILSNELISIITGVIILMITGVFVSDFIGNRLLLTGLKGEKKLTEKTEEEIVTEETMLDHLQTSVGKIEEEIRDLKKDLDRKS